MAGTLELTEELCWMPAGWVYDRALVGMSDFVNTKVREQMLGCLTDINGGYLDLRKATADEVEETHEALKLLIKKTKDDGPEAMHDPTFYDGYVQELVELENLFRLRRAVS